MISAATTIYNGSHRSRFDYVAYKRTQLKLTNLKENSFNQTSARFITFYYKIRSTLGFDQYRISVFINENFGKAVV
jgi:hypothetical protein